MKRLLPFLIILSVLGVALGSAWYMRRAANAPATVGVSSSPAVPGASSRPQGSTIIAPGAVPPHTKGPATATVTIEEFGDFECPPCALLHPILKTMENEFEGRMRIIFREYPPVPNHQHALYAASAAEAAALQGKFWEMHHKLYENQKTWHEAFDVRPIFDDYAKQIGLDLERFKRDINSDGVARRITEDGKRGRSLGVKGTPPVLMNGREVRFEAIMDPSRLRNAITAELGNSR